MTDLHLEVHPAGAAPVGPGRPRAWPAAAGATGDVRTGVGWSMRELGSPPAAARDLLRVAGAAYLADRAARTPRQGLARHLVLDVHVEAPDLWNADARAHAVDLLHWLTGDEWALGVLPAGPAPDAEDVLDLPLADDVALLSGGLDSLCGALVRLCAGGAVQFVGHAEGATAVRRAQIHLQGVLAARNPAVAYHTYAFGPASGTGRGNSVPRTRSLLFAALGVAAATGVGARRVLVPENGFTSVNPPLEPSRGGPLTTRSTHPWTFHALAGLLGALGLDVVVSNPHAEQTKGELLAQAMPGRTAEDQRLAAATVSCAKINAGRIKGGDAMTQCGLCIACLVRRGAFAGAGLPDLTAYSADTLPALGQHALRRMRRHDLRAWEAATRGGLPEHRVLGAGMWPSGTDLDAVLDLVRRGLAELARVPV